MYVYIKYCMSINISINDNKQRVSKILSAPPDTVDEPSLGQIFWSLNIVRTLPAAILAIGWAILVHFVHGWLLIPAFINSAWLTIFGIFVFILLMIFWVYGMYAFKAIWDNINAIFSAIDASTRNFLMGTTRITSYESNVEENSEKPINKHFISEFVNKMEITDIKLAGKFMKQDESPEMFVNLMLSLVLYINDLIKENTTHFLYPMTTPYQLIKRQNTKQISVITEATRAVNRVVAAKRIEPSIATYVLKEIDSVDVYLNRLKSLLVGFPYQMIELLWISTLIYTVGIVTVIALSFSGMGIIGLCSTVVITYVYIYMLYSIFLNSLYWSRLLRNPGIRTSVESLRLKVEHVIRNLTTYYELYYGTVY